MSQRSAFSAAASATAEVSDPPRPSVVMRLSGADALEAGDHGDLARLHAADQLGALDVGDARLAVRVVGADRDLPALPGARLDADLLQRDRQQAGGDLLAGRDHGVVFARVVQRRQALAPARRAGWWRRPWPRPRRRPRCPPRPRASRGSATLRMRSRSATEVPPNFITMRDIGPASCQWSSVGRWSYWRGTAGATMPGMTVSPDGGCAVRRAGGALVGSGRADAAAAPDEPGADRLDCARTERSVPAPCGRGDCCAPVRLLDVGCGAGAGGRGAGPAGFDVLGLDAAGEAIEAARAHAAGQGLPLAYRTGVAEDLLAEGAALPGRHGAGGDRACARPAAFLATLAALLEPGGKLFLSTLNRTPRSFLAAKVGAEYLLRWLPVGTHDWRKFVTPAELGGMLRRVGLRVSDIAGLVADPLTGRWGVSRNLSVNYLVAVEG